MTTSVITVPYIPTSSSIGNNNQILTNSGWITSPSNPAVKIDDNGITLQKHGDIYQMSDGKVTDKGLFDRLERLERMMGILRRDKGLENVYKPLQEAGDKYDAVLDDAIADIMNIAINTMKQHADDYEQLKTEARVYHALTKDTDNAPRP